MEHLRLHLALPHHRQDFPGRNRGLGSDTDPLLLPTTRLQRLSPRYPSHPQEVPQAPLQVYIKASLLCTTVHNYFDELAAGLI